MHRSKMMSVVSGALTFALTLAVSPAAWAVDEFMDGKIVMVQGENHFRDHSVRFNTGDGRNFDLPDSSNDPRDSHLHHAEGLTRVR